MSTQATRDYGSGSQNQLFERIFLLLSFAFPLHLPCEFFVSLFLPLARTHTSIYTHFPFHNTKTTPFAHLLMRKIGENGCFVCLFGRFMLVKRRHSESNDDDYTPHYSLASSRRMMISFRSLLTSQLPCIFFPRTHTRSLSLSLYSTWSSYFSNL